jgi:hypothetical protein
VDRLINTWSLVAFRIGAWPTLSHILAGQCSLRLRSGSIHLNHWPPTFLSQRGSLILNQILDHTKALPTLDDWYRVNMRTRDTISRIITLYTVKIIVSTYSVQNALINSITTHGSIVFMRICEMVIHISCWEDNREERKGNVTYSKKRPNMSQDQQDIVKNPFQQDGASMFFVYVLKAVTSTAWIDNAESIFNQIISNSLDAKMDNSIVNVFIHLLQAVWRRYVYASMIPCTASETFRIPSESSIFSIFDVLYFSPNFITY